MKEQEYQQLISSFLKGNQAAIGHIYDNYADALYGIILPVVKDENIATDILQDSFVKIWQNRRKYDPAKGRLFTWMARICRNTTLNKIESKDYRNAQRIHGDENSVLNVEQKYPMELCDLKGIVTQLPNKYQEVILYLYFKGYTQVEASEELEVPLGTIKTRVKAALRELRKVYEFEKKEVLIMILVIIAVI